MTRVAASTLLTLILAVAPALAQAPAAPASQPAAEPAQPAAPAPPPPRPFPEGAKFAFLNTQRVAAESAVGRNATARLKALNDRKVQELNERQKQLQAQQQKLQQGGSVLSDEARADLEKAIEKSQIDIQRFTQDAQAEVQELNQELQNEFEQQLRPIIAAVSQERGLQMVFGPDSGIVWADAGLDITADVIQRFDKTSAGAPAAPRP